MGFKISDAELKRRALTAELTATKFLPKKPSHGDVYAGTGSGGLRSGGLPDDIRVPLRSDQKFEPLPPISEIRNG